ncbi:LADA_0H00364g1_1 [Lachancea dasiensis]|uniref:LADA_0H00364g1_1 n=1 Tax=Lachancea dasiensis TaxID=1072105 RepID=A0A1G4JYQ7_9SACH|nr:LADA_0H00364g1_1 [Lachancea dasiensis]
MVMEHSALSHFFKTGKVFHTVDASAPGKIDPNVESMLISGLETLAGLFDDVYLLKSFGIISEVNYVYKKVNKGGLCSKIWLVSLILSSRRCISDLFQLAVSRSRLKREEKHFNNCITNSFRKALHEKIALKVQEIDRRLRLTILDLLQNLAYLVVVAIDVFSISISQRWRHILDRLSGFFSVLKLLLMGNVIPGT